jgi:hypothetical protein
MFRPLSFTKNLGGFKNLHQAIRVGYAPGITVSEFAARLPETLRSRAPIMTEFFLATRLIGGAEYLIEDTLVRHTFYKPYSQTHARLYLFSVIANLPGERLSARHRSPAEPHNTFVRNVLFKEDGWRASAIDLGTIKPWVRENVQLSGGRTKFATNFRNLFEQCNFGTLTSGVLRTYANSWGPLALRLFFERQSLGRNGDVEALIRAAETSEIHKLLGVGKGWAEKVLKGAAVAFADGRPDLLVEWAAPDEESGDSPAGPPNPQIKKLVALGKRDMVLF